MTKKRPKGICFDVFGTLLELNNPVARLRRELAQRLSLEFSEREVQIAFAAEIAYYRAHMIEGSDEGALASLHRECAAELRNALPVRAHQVDLDILTDVLITGIDFQPFPEVREVLEKLSESGLRLAAISNWDCSLERTLEKTGLRRYFDIVVSSAVFGASKPNPAIFEHSVRLLKLDPGECWHVGDSYHHDVLGALGAGVRPVLIERIVADNRASTSGSFVVKTLGEDQQKENLTIATIVSLHELGEMLGLDRAHRQPKVSRS